MSRRVACWLLVGLMAAAAAIAAVAAARPDPDSVGARWDALPMPSFGAGIVESTAIVGVDGQVVLAVGTRRGDREHLRFWRLSELGRWQRVALQRSVSRDLSQPLALAAFRGQACAVVGHDGQFRLACVAPESGKVSISAAVPKVGDGAGVNALSAIAGDVYVTINGSRDAARRASRMPTAVRHPRVLVFRFDGTSWTQLALAGVGDGHGGQLAEIGARPCVLLTGSVPGGGRDEAAGVHCESDASANAWLSTTPPVRRDREFGIFAGHSLATLGGDPLVGVLNYAPSGGKPNGAWRVLRLDGGRWQPTPLTVGGDAYLAQGHLYTFGDQAWSFLFEQRPVGSGMNLIARLRVQRLGSNDQTATDVGRPFIDRQEIFGPIDYGLAEIDGQIYAAYMKPDAGRKQNLPQVAVLTNSSTP